jgi:hypothetical protein
VFELLGGGGEMKAQSGLSAEWALVTGQVRMEFVEAGAMIVAIDGDVRVAARVAARVVREGECWVIDERGVVSVEAEGARNVRCGVIEPAGFWPALRSRWPSAMRGRAVPMTG